MRANVVLIDGKPEGVIGVCREPDWGKFFSDTNPQLQPYLKSITVWRAITGAMEYVRAYRGPVLAVAQHADGCLWLHRLGFRHLQGAWYGWLG
jgi:hypothetical protein